VRGIAGGQGGRDHRITTESQRDLEGGAEQRCAWLANVASDELFSGALPSHEGGSQSVVRCDWMRPIEYPNLARSLARDPTLADRFTGPESAAWRRACGVSQYRLAGILGIHRTTIARYELGTDPTPRWYALALAAAEPLIRKQHALRRDRLRNRVGARRRRKRELEAREAAAAASRSYW
jgi:DNA-binding XRE family transcriptional regulator